MKTRIISILLILLTFMACKDIIEDDLTRQSVNLLAPPDAFHTTISTHSFWWDVVEGSEGYNLQIVSPSFDYIERLFLDTNITFNRYDYSL
ncbi:MAG: hypothetical protein K8R68_06150, partial [Bacteroidales bacterium]|nr:hypothetical protein [Bacteroidales bacterium]